jgi:hypothetical protein
MNKDKEYFGIDISKSVLDICDNNYQYQAINSYIQMQLSRVKIDKSDSKMIL